MIKLPRKALPGILLSLALLAGSWAMPQQAVRAQDNTSQLPAKVNAQSVISSRGSLKLSKTLADSFENSQQRVDQIDAFKLNMGAINRNNVSKDDKEFISDSITSNALELVTMEYAYNKVKDPDLKNLLDVMLVMHSKDMRTSIELANKLGIDTTADFVKASVYPETPDYDLGIRVENLKSDYLDKLTAPTSAPFDEVALEVLNSEHTSDVQSELAAERLTTNAEIKTMTKHSADVTELHLKFMDQLDAKLVQKLSNEPGTTPVQAEYQSPVIITIHEKSNEK